MLHSKLAGFLLVLLTLLLSACVTTGGNQSSLEKKISSSDTGSATTTNSLEDPMATVLPLNLIKAYDEVDSLLAKKNTKQALVNLNRLQQQYPESSGPAYRIARVNFQQKRFDDALKAVTQSITVKPENYYALNLKAVIQREKGDFKQAKETYEMAIRRYDAYPVTHLNYAILADIYLYDLKLALQQYEKYLALVEHKDKKVKGWVIDLKRRMAKGN